MFKLYSVLMCVLLLYSCEHAPTVEPDTEIQTIEYSNLDTITITAGDTYTSISPTIEGTSPYQLIVNSIPAHDGAITIGDDGEIVIGNTLAVGTYNLTLTATNSVGSSSFEDILVVNITANNIPPSGLSYTSDTLFINPSDGGSSNVPSITGSSPITYSITSNPSATSFITIENDGSITVASNLTEGNYTISVEATNNVTTTTFSDIIVISSNTQNFIPSNLTYGNDTLYVEEAQTGAMTVSQIDGSSPFTYMISSTIPTGVSINGSTGEISVSDAAIEGEYTLDINVSNSAGDVDFNDIITVKVTEKKVRYTEDILPIITTNCTPCHISGSQPKWNNYSTFKTNIIKVLDRIQRTPGTTGFMPNGGTSSIGTTNIDLIKQWQTDGLLE